MDHEQPELGRERSRDDDLEEAPQPREEDAIHGDLALALGGGRRRRCWRRLLLRRALPQEQQPFVPAARAPIERC